MGLDMTSLGGIWSATPTPLNDAYECDVDCLERLVEHHIRLGVTGLFLAGTCGEGPWLSRRTLRTLVQGVRAAAADRLHLAVQITDNSAARMLENAEDAAADGADIVVIAPPYFLLNATPENVAAVYRETIRRSPLPVGIYDRGRGGAVPVADSVIEAVYAEPNVVLVKDSSTDPERRDIALAARLRRPGLCVLTGYEFDIVSYLEHGYDGALLGGGIFNGYLAGNILAACRAGEKGLAAELQQRMNALMWDVYGGKQITCWLTGLKEMLVRLGVFDTNRNLLNYPLTPECSRTIDAAIERERDALLP